MPRVLLVKLSALGDVIQTLPVLSALKRARENWRIDWVVEEENAEILRGHPLIEELFPFPRRRILRLLRSGEIGKALKLWGEFLEGLRARPYEVVLDLQGLFKSALVVALARGKRKLGFANHREGSTLVLTEKLPAYDPDLHAVRRYLSAAEILGGVAEPVDFPMAPYPSAGEMARKLGLPPPPWLVFIPATRWETKLWPEEHWRALAERAPAFGLPLLWVGGPGDREYVSRLAVSGLNLAGGLSLKELAGILSGAAAVVSVDTGPMHLAAALGRPVVALFGPTAPWRTGPFGKGHRILHSGLPCAPCFRRRCPAPRCLSGISPEEVLKALREVLAGNRAENPQVRK
ncbi:lipopolysaccharide heptosyltransferase I [Thermosulfurimonas marina]|uniref:lipopolysaccharide heptosyltransferase I n=1 Tax=Thermosulfurimonas marina TaxID=2047767 RepID=UPI00144A527E|nr:lipopolysaccharide heptosyltransferase I [Thermosulfurimonas marina]